MALAERRRRQSSPKKHHWPTADQATDALVRCYYTVLLLIVAVYAAAPVLIATFLVLAGMLAIWIIKVTARECRRLYLGEPRKRNT